MTHPLFSRGTQISTDNLIGLSALASQLPIKRQKRILNDQAGSHISRIRGRGMEFSEVRGYQAGDDIRAMDWRVTARTGNPHIKLFQEERERPVIVACDLRSNMWFGTRRALKSVVAADVSALISWSAFAAGDRIGGLIFNDEQEIDQRPSSGRKGLLRWLTQLSQVARCDYQPADLRLSEVLAHIQRVAKPGSSVFIVSDWYGFSEQNLNTLQHIARHCDITAIRIIDPLEYQLPQQSLALTDGRQQRQLRINKSMAQQYRQQFDQQHQQLTLSLNQLGIPLLRLQTDSDLLSELRSGLGISGRAITQGRPNG